MPSLAEIHKVRIAGDGENMVFLGHGFGTDQTVWHNLEPLLIRRHYKVVLYNMMGQGTGTFLGTSLGHSDASSNTDSLTGSSGGDPFAMGRKAGSALQRATSEVAQEDFAKQLRDLELEEAGVFGGSEGRGGKKGAFSKRVGQTFDRIFGRNKVNKEKIVQTEKEKVRPVQGAEKASNGAPHSGPEFSGRRTFKVEDLEKGERPESIKEEETEGLVTAEDFNYTRYTTLDAFAEDLINLMDELKLKKCSYIGHSVGGMIGVLASVKRPDLFKKLILLASSPRYLNDGDYVGGFKDEDINNLLTAVKTNYKQWVQGFAPVAIHTPNNEAVADYAASLLDVRPDVAYCILNTIFRSDYRHILPQVTVPCHILVSNDDVAVPPPVGIYLNKHLKGSVLEAVNVHGHLPHLSAPMIVNAAFIKHLEQPP